MDTAAVRSRPHTTSNRRGAARLSGRLKYWRVILLDPHNGEPPKLMHTSASLREALASVRAWMQKPMGYIAVAWPKWATLPEGLVDIDDIQAETEATEAATAATDYTHRYSVAIVACPPSWKPDIDCDPPLGIVRPLEFVHRGLTYERAEKLARAANAGIAELDVRGRWHVVFAPGSEGCHHE